RTCDKHRVSILACSHDAANGLRYRAPCRSADAGTDGVRPSATRVLETAGTAASRTAAPAAADERECAPAAGGHEAAECVGGRKLDTRARCRSPERRAASGRCA